MQSKLFITYIELWSTTVMFTLKGSMFLCHFVMKLFKIIMNNDVCKSVNTYFQANGVFYLQANVLEI